MDTVKLDAVQLYKYHNMDLTDTVYFFVRRGEGAMVGYKCALFYSICVYIKLKSYYWVRKFHVLTHQLSKKRSDNTTPQCSGLLH